MSRIVVKSGPNKGRVYEIENDVITIGRDPACTIQILDQGVSRNHAEIFRIDEMCFIRDLESRNGTYIHGQKIDEELMTEGDMISIGQTKMAFELDEAKQASASLNEILSAGIVEMRFGDIEKMSSGEENEDGTKNFNAIIKLARIISLESSFSSLKRKIVSYFSEVLKAENIFLYMRDPKTTRLNVEFKRTAKSENEEGSKLSKTIVRHVARTKKPVLTSNAAADMRFKASDSVVREKIESVICLPIFNRNEFIGILYLENDKDGHAFSTEDLIMAQVVSSITGMALDSAKNEEFEREQIFSVIKNLVSAIETKQPGKAGHSERVANYCRAMGMEVKLSEKAIFKVCLAALLHNVGKFCLKDDERIENYPNISAGIIHEMYGLEEMSQAIKHHRERFDGSGYPSGLSEETIPLLSRIIGVACYFDELITGDDGDSPKTPSQALATMEALSGKQFHEKVVKALKTAYEDGMINVNLDQI